MSALRKIVVGNALHSFLITFWIKPKTHELYEIIKENTEVFEIVLGCHDRINIDNFLNTIICNIASNTIVQQ